MELQTGKKALLVVSFGTSRAAARPLTIEAVEDDLRRAFPKRSFYRAWTSGMLRRKLEREEGVSIDSVAEALQRMLTEGVSDVLVQPTHLLPGDEFRRTEEAVRAFAGRFRALALGRPLLAGESDVKTLARIVEEACPTDEGELLVLMGHGSAGLAFPAYAELERQFRADGHPRVCVGTVEFEPGIAPVLARIRQERPRRVLLAPLLAVAGEHVMNDMAGDGPDSWKNQIAREGPEVACRLTGLAELAAVRELYVRHARAAQAVTV